MVELETVAYDGVSVAMICEKVKKFHSEFTAQKFPTKATHYDFKTSRRQFGKFCKKSGIHRMVSPGEACNVNKAAAEAYKKESMEFRKLQEYAAQQVFNHDET